MPTPTPLPVAIQGTVTTASHDVVNWLLFVATALLAVYTYRLFVSTRNIASDTLAAARLADRHHQESLRPVIKILSARVTYQEWVREGWLKRERGRTVGGPKVDLTQGQSAFGRLRCFVRINNIGTGPALNVQATFVIDGFGAQVFPIESLSIGEGTEIQPAVDIDDQLELEAQASLHFDLAVTYANVFNSVGISRCRCAPGPGLIAYEPPVYVPRDIGLPESNPAQTG